MRLFLITLTAAAVLTAPAAAETYGTIEEAAQAAVKEKLLDPESATFLISKTIAGTSESGGHRTTVCGFVRAKTRLGAYNGPAPFRAFVFPSGDGYSGFADVSETDRYQLLAFYGAAPECRMKLPVQ